MKFYRIAEYENNEYTGFDTLTIDPAIAEEKVKWLKEIWNGPKDVHWYLEEVEAEDMTQACTAEPVSKKKII